jgi:hypothetical protein
MNPLCRVLLENRKSCREERSCYLIIFQKFKMLVSLMNAINLLASFTNRYSYPESGYHNSERGRSLNKVPPFVQTELGGYEGYFMKVLGGREIYAFEGVHFAEEPERFKVDY